MLCEFAHRFPLQLAELLERDRHLTRNFREETATDLLMMGLTPLQTFGVRIDFPNEPVTGADMDWIYAAPHEVGGGRYLRLLIQAKRAREQPLKVGNYWYYDHLDHGVPAGSQAQTLVNYAASSPDGMTTLPLYMLYHPASALQPAFAHRPAIEGINLLFARDVAPVVAGGCGREYKRVGHWRDRFMSLPDFLCWPVMASTANPPPPPTEDSTAFVSRATAGFLTDVPAAFHPDLVADRLNEIARERPDAYSAKTVDLDDGPARVGEGIPEDIQRAIDGKMTEEDRKRIVRPRVILSTPLSRESPDFGPAREVSQYIHRRRRRGE